MLSQIGIAGWELISLLFPLLFLAMVFFLVRWAVSSGVRSAMSDSHRNRRDEFSAAEVLERRYAAGEIGREEYLTIRGDITREQNA